jgi:hypothetical protein
LVEHLCAADAITGRYERRRHVVTEQRNIGALRIPATPFWSPHQAHGAHRANSLNSATFSHQRLFAGECENSLVRKYSGKPRSSAKPIVKRHFRVRVNYTFITHFQKIAQERAGAFVHNGNDRVFECGAARGRRAMHKTDTGIK